MNLIEDHVRRFGSKLPFSPAYNGLRRGSRILNNDIELDDGNSALNFSFVLGTTLFGAIHIGAWNFDFPSRIELIFWRCASLYSTAYFLILSIIEIISKISEKFH